MSSKGSDNQLSKCDKLVDCVQQSVSEKVKQKIAHIISEINQFNDIEKLLLYIQLPNGSPGNDPLKHKGPGNPFGKKADIEVAQTYTWIQSHLEEDSTVSLPKHEVYDEYKCFCQSNNFEPLCVADFGKAMKHVFPRVKPRRLGQRGNSKYCYSGLRKKLNLPAPCLPDLSLGTPVNSDDNRNTSSITTSNADTISNTINSMEEESSDPFYGGNSSGEGLNGGSGGLSQEIVHNAATRLILDWAEKCLKQSFTTLQDLGKYLIDCDLVDKRSGAAFALVSSACDDGPSAKTLFSQIKNKRETSINTTHLSAQKKLHQKGLIKDGSSKKRLERGTKGSTSCGLTISLSSSSSPSTTTTTVTTSSVALGKGRRGRKLSVNGSNGRSDDTNDSVVGDSSLKTTSEATANVKQEEDIKLIDIGQKTILPKVHSTMPQNKVPIPRNSASPHIIVLPNLRLSATRSTSQAMSDKSVSSQSVPVSLATSSSAIKSRCSSPSSTVAATSSSSSAVIVAATSSATSKYKRIQPKPVSLNQTNSSSTIDSSTLNYSNTGSNTSLESIDSNGDNIVKRRHSSSLAVTNMPTGSLISGEAGILGLVVGSVAGQTIAAAINEERSSEKNQTKRHCDVNSRDNSNVSSCKKRLTTTIKMTLGNNEKPLGSSGSAINNGLNSDETNSSTSLSPLPQISSAAAGQVSIADQISSTDMCIKLQELECDALNDDLTDNGCSNMDSYQDCNPNTLSQLRRLLEKNLPKSKNSSSSTGDVGISKQLADRQHQIQPSTVATCFPIDPRQATSLTSTGTTINIKLESNQEDDRSNQYCQQSVNHDSLLLVNSFTMEKIDQKLGSIHAIDSSTMSINSLTSGGVVDSTSAGHTGNAGGMGSMGDFTSIQTQIPSVPASPNTRRQAFSFQPISQRITPTIPENSTINNYGSSFVSSNNNTNLQHSPPAYNPNQRSIGVGLSQPPSSANSPFVSPRGTPIPLSRSRHDSGQSGYSASRQTPYPVLDSGLSSISSSPFISPQSTPVPLSSRMRASNNALNSYHHQRNLVSRARHSSGPGNPYTTIPQNMSTFVMRSSSVSPMVNPNSGDMLVNCSTLASINAAFNGANSNGCAGKRSRNQSSTTATTTTSGASTADTPVSPVSEPLSPSLVSGDNISTCDLTGSNHGDSFLDSCFTPRDWANSRSFHSSYPVVGTNMRQRHFSSPYATLANNSSISMNDSHSKEIQNLLKGGSLIESLLHSSNCNGSLLGGDVGLTLGTGNDDGDRHGRPPLNRCHSVPAQHQQMKLYNGYTNSMEQSFPPSLSSSIELSPESEIPVLSKSYPPTPLCTPPNFHHFPSSPSTVTTTTTSSGLKLSSASSNLDDEPTTPTTAASNASSSFLESGQDVMVSGLQAKDWSTGETVINDDMDLNVHHHHHHHHQNELSPGNNLLNSFEVRRVIDEAISGPPAMSDDLETTLEDLRDCDNDFSKFALELELGANDTSNNIEDI